MAISGSPWDVAHIAGIIDRRPLWRRVLDDRQAEATRAAFVEALSRLPAHRPRCVYCGRIGFGQGNATPYCRHHRRWAP